MKKEYLMEIEDGAHVFELVGCMESSAQ